MRLYQERPEKSGPKQDECTNSSRRLEVKEKLKTAISESQKLDVSKAGTYTVSSWVKTWYEVYAEPRIRPNTKAYYTNYIENHIIPGIGNISLDKLTTIQIQRFYNTLQKSGRVQRKNFPELKDKSLSPRVVRGVHTLLHNCLEQAVAERLILTNPAQGCKLPHITRCAADMAIRLVLAEEHGNNQRAAARLGVTDRALQIRRKAAACAACHGADGNSAASANPHLAGQVEEYIYKQLKNFKCKNSFLSFPLHCCLEKRRRIMNAYFGLVKSTKFTFFRQLFLSQKGFNVTLTY